MAHRKSWYLTKIGYKVCSSVHLTFLNNISSVQFSCSVVSNSLGPCGQQHSRLPCPSPTPRACSISCPLTQCDAIQPSHPLPPSSPLPSIVPSIKVFSSESALCIKWPKYWSFRKSPSNKHSGLISFRIDWFDPLAIQGSLKNLLRHHSLKVSVIWSSGFFTDQLSRTGKTIALTYMDLCWQSDVSAF